ncbi:MAG: hypothetical protein A2091_11160 [Desulfuromonadales bacterium GWD2_61_12]|nr:MAG: hypothetical protein A2005_02850 [Desulfuromonadales bacterium GWC2_61_20]OGR36645.1 MAG: hypothetical protein A2091_11160 [Desulfuromonadales bacterium GWD2_61_12]HAD03149.1 amidophosphoribosyltransferase [Desulfuromonas sp.]HBT84131.1 amidophosphoribosyltransferase [Desulfuromonas sp.]
MLPVVWLKEEWAGLLEIFLPPVCPLCSKSLVGMVQKGFCADCRAGMPPLTPPCCPRCALPYPTASGSDHLCEECLRRPPPFLWTAAAGIYDGELRRAIRHFKFNGAFHLDGALAELLREALTVRLDSFAPQLLVPVPLHPSRLRQRSFNQALLLARHLGRHCHIAVAPRLLQRVRATPPQPGLSVEERRRNLRQAFALGRPLTGERVLLIDDVMTTGATARACAEVLRAGGAAEVAVAVLGRAQRQQL